MKVKNIQYSISYLSNEEKIDELYSTFEVILLLIISKFVRKVKILSIELNEFCSDDFKKEEN